MVDYALANKGEIWLLLGAEAMNLAVFLSDTTDPDAITLNKMFENVDGIHLDSALMQNTILPMLVNKGVLSTGTIDVINAYIAGKLAPAAFGVE
jgi:chemotaxis response regulator CheB